MALSPPTIIHGAPNDEGKRRVGCVGFVAHTGLPTGERRGYGEGSGAKSDADLVRLS